MQCKTCGAQLKSGAKICEHCGNVVCIPPENSSFCKKCGLPLNTDVKFCPACGAKINENINGKTPIIIISVLASALLTAIGVLLGATVFSDREMSANPKTAATESIVPTNEPTDIPQNTQTADAITPLPAQSDNADSCYSPALTYKRMPEIHNSVPASDYIYNEAYNTVYGFDTACEAYMNGYGDIPQQLLYGSTAYNQQTNYKKRHPHLTQTYEQINIRDVRQYGDYCYVWVTEILTQYENSSSKTTDEHWVYKLINRGGTLYITDYTADPA